jgi:hypothetical protein
MSKEKPSKLEKELGKLGISEEVFSAALALSPARQVVAGYPQKQISNLSVQQNW